MNPSVEQMPAPNIAWHQRMSLKASGALLAAGGVFLTGCAEDREPLSAPPEVASASCGDVDFQPKSDAEGNFGYKVTPHSVTDNAEMTSYHIAWEEGQHAVAVLREVREGADGDPYFHAYKKPGNYEITVKGQFQDLTDKKADPIMAECGTKNVKVTAAQIRTAKEVRDSPYQWPEEDTQSWG